MNIVTIKNVPHIEDYRYIGTEKFYHWSPKPLVGTGYDLPKPYIHNIVGHGQVATLFDPRGDEERIPYISKADASRANRMLGSGGSGSTAIIRNDKTDPRYSVFQGKGQKSCDVIVRTGSLTSIYSPTERNQPKGWELDEMGEAIRDEKGRKIPMYEALQDWQGSDEDKAEIISILKDEHSDDKDLICSSELVGKLAERDLPIYTTVMTTCADPQEQFYSDWTDKEDTKAFVTSIFNTSNLAHWKDTSPSKIRKHVISSKLDKRMKALDGLKLSDKESRTRRVAMRRAITKVMDNKTPRKKVKARYGLPTWPMQHVDTRQKEAVASSSNMYTSKAITQRGSSLETPAMPWSE